MDPELKCDDLFSILYLLLIPDICCAFGTSRQHWDPGLLLSNVLFVSTIRSICAGRQRWINYLSSHLFDSGSNFMTNRQTTPFKTGPTNLCVASLNWLIAYFQEVPSTWSEYYAAKDQMHFQPAFESRVVSSVNYWYKYDINQQCGPVVPMTCLVAFVEANRTTRCVK